MRFSQLRDFQVIQFLHGSLQLLVCTRVLISIDIDIDIGIDLRLTE